MRGTTVGWFIAGTVFLLPAAPLAALQTTIGGRTVDLDTAFSVREVAEANRSTKHERTLELLRVHAGVSLTDWLRFESTTVGANGGPTLKADRSGVYSWDDVFQDISPAADFAEAYLDVSLSSLDLRVGKQKLAWGKLDRTQPNDLINPLDYSDPFLESEEDAKIGVPLVQAAYDLPEAPAIPEQSRLTAVWVPKYLPFRFPLASCTIRGGTSYCDAERWFPPAAIPPSSFTVPAGVVPIAPGVFNPAFRVPLAFRVQNQPPPAWTLANSELALRYSALIHDADVALYYFHGFDPQPAFNLTAAAVGQVDANPANPLHLNFAGVTTLTPVFRQIDSWGADFAYALGGFTVRGEGAYVRGRAFNADLRNLVSNPEQLKAPLSAALTQLIGQGGGEVPVALPQPVFAVHDSVEWGLGADYLYSGYLTLLQVNQTDVLHNHLGLLIKNVETRLLADLHKSLWADTLEIRLVGVHAVESDYTYLIPRVRYRVTDNVLAEAGYLFIAGRAQSIGGEYRRNDEGWVRFEYQL